MFPSLLPQFGSAFSLLKKGVSQYFCPYNKCNECTSHWGLVMSFFAHGLHLNTDWIYFLLIISLSFLSFVVEQQKQVGRSPSVGSSEQNQELSKLRADLENKTAFYEEEQSRREQQHANELKNLKKDLRESEGQQLTLKKEIMMLKDKLEKTRRERYWSYCKRLRFTSAGFLCHHVLFCFIIQGLRGWQLNCNLD